MDDGETGAATVNWVTHTAFSPPLVEIVEQGDHHIVVGEVIAAVVHKTPEGRPDEAILEMKELGDNVFYGG
jgi:flavin reductase (DIM6/NTAB) family NADH-FMN oxidoreductase RutF